MASCVLSLINQGLTDEGVACMVHTHYAPCVRGGEPANPEPIHGDDHLGREAAVEMWKARTGGQRPFVIHRGALVGAEHSLTADCWCGPELLGAVA